MKLIALFILISFLSACSFGVPIGASKTDSTKANTKGTPYKKPSSYIVFGKQYTVLKSSEGYVKRGVASWYGKKFHGRNTSNGETYDMFAMTAAHKTLPLPTKVSVKNLSNGKSIIVNVNDRGPFINGRLIDLSYAAAKKLGIIEKGTANVEVRALNKANVSPSVRIIPLKSADLTEPDFYIQVGSFGLKKNANTLVMQLNKQNFDDANLYPIETTKGNFYRVRIGPYALLEKAQSILKQLKLKQFDQARLIVEN